MQPFEATPGEKRWFLVYAPAAFVARMLMLFGIALVVASKFFLIGVLIALWSLWTGIGLPLWKMVAHVFTSPQLHRNSAYAVRMPLGVGGCLAVGSAWCGEGVCESGYISGVGGVFKKKQ